MKLHEKACGKMHSKVSNHSEISISLYVHILTQRDKSLVKFLGGELVKGVRKGWGTGGFLPSFTEVTLASVKHIRQSLIKLGFRVLKMMSERI